MEAVVRTAINHRWLGMRSAAICMLLSLIVVLTLGAANATAAMRTPKIGKSTKRWSQVSAHCAKATHVRYQGRSCRQANGLWRVELPNKHSLLSHGPDASSPRAMNGIPQLNSATSMALQSSSSDDITCVNPNTTQYTALIYARPSGAADRSATIAPLLRQELYQASAYLNVEAEIATPGAGARFKVSCDGGGEATVQSVELSHSGSDDNFSTIAGDLQDLGFNSANGRYMVFYDGSIGNGIAGQGALYDDDSGGVDSLNNYGGLIAVEYSIGDLLPHWDVLLHEAGHNMGAVQDSAPNSSLSGHCNDGMDIMCYSDGGSGQISHPYTNSACSSETFDCGHNDYFNPSPSPNSYLDTHWNTGASYNMFLDHSVASSDEPAPGQVDLTAPTLPTGVTTSYTGATSVTLTWNQSTDDQSLVSYRIYQYNGTFWSAIDSSDTTSYTVWGLSPDHGYDIGVAAFDSSSNESNLSIISVATAADITAPSRPSSVRTTLRAQHAIGIAWNASTDDVGVNSYRVYRSIGSGWKYVGISKNRKFLNKGLKRHKRYFFAVYAVDGSANASMPSRVIAIKTT